MNHDDDFVAWIETLPFPLASILWAYHADVDEQQKVEHLFLFFEALSQFTAVVMLSAYAGDKDFYAQESGAWIENDPKFKDWILTASFGQWKILGERLAKVTRKLQEDKNKKERCLELLGKPDPEFLEMLTNKKLFDFLGRVSKHRNDWKGHGGAVNLREYHNRLIQLESCLSEVRQIVLDRWESTLLLLPGSCDYSEGIYEFQVKVLMGTRTPFKKQTVKTLVPMDKRQLYLIHNDEQKPVELLPFIRFMSSPETQQNACYFYNRIKQNNEVRWVSYHFDSEAEIVSLDNEVISAISLLRTANHDAGELTP